MREKVAVCEHVPNGCGIVLSFTTFLDAEVNEDFAALKKTCIVACMSYKTS